VKRGKSMKATELAVLQQGLLAINRDIAHWPGFSANKRRKLVLTLRSVMSALSSQACDRYSVNVGLRCSAANPRPISPHIFYFAGATSTRRFSARPFAVALSATGRVAPKPCGTNRFAATPFAVSHDTTDAARASERV